MYDGVEYEGQLISYKGKESRLSGGFSPGGPHADERADGTGDTNDAIVEVDVLERGNGDGEIAEVGEELSADLRALPISIPSPR